MDVIERHQYENNTERDSYDKFAYHEMSSLIMTSIFLSS